jgi:hypothetical protein
MTTTTIRQDAPKVPAEKCPHCYGGTIFEPTDDTLEDEAIECPACLGTARRMHRAERLAIRNARELDAQWSALERMGL